MLGNNLHKLQQGGPNKVQCGNSQTPTI